MDINIFVKIYDLFRKAAPPVEHFNTIIVLLTVEHISILVWLKSHQQILILKEKAPYEPGLGIPSPTKQFILALTYT